MLAPGEGQVKQVKISNMILSWDTTKDLIFEIDIRHVEIIIEQLRLQDAKLVTTSGTKEEDTTQSDMDEKLDVEIVSKYRALVARHNYLNPDRLDISYSVKEMARNISESNKDN